MDLRPSDEQEQLVEAFSALYAKESPPERVRAAEPLGFDRKLWERLVEMGTVSMAVGESDGGWGASMLDLALVAREHGRALGAAPLIEAQVAARTLARAGGDDAGALLAEAMAGDRLVTMALRPRRSGVAPLVPAGAVATDVIVGHGDALRVVGVDGTPSVPENIGSMSVADIPVPDEVLASAPVLGTGTGGRSGVEAALDDWLVLTANALVGMAQRSIEIGVAYVTEREAFGQKIGGFQAVGHRLADCATATDGADLLAREAAWAFDEDAGRAPGLAAMAFAFAAETARDASDAALHFHGGYGFMLEYDIQLYYRRARAWANVVMSPSAARRRVADLRYGPRGVAVTDFHLGATSDRLRAEVRAFLDEQMTPELEERTYRSGVSHDDAFARALIERGWMALSWPEARGGRGLDPLETTVVHEELRRADAPTYAVGTTLMVAHVIDIVGTERQKAAVIPRALSGEIIIVLGFSEPEAGSDVAAVATRAERDGDDWVINGQKMFTTNAQLADYAFLLTRTNTQVAKHKGLTMFLVPLDQPGVEVQAVYTLSGERTNITFYNDVRVSDDWRIGDVDDGWGTMTVALADEHGAGFATAIERLLEAAEEWAAGEVDDDGAAWIEDVAVREALARTAIDTEVSYLLQRRAAWMAAADLPMTTQGPMAKLFSSEALRDRAEELFGLVGPDGLRSYLGPSAPVGGVIEYLLRFSVGTRIYAGTSEIHRNMIAQRGLGLPRTK